MTAFTVPCPTADGYRPFTQDLREGDHIRWVRVDTIDPLDPCKQAQDDIAVDHTPKDPDDPTLNLPYDDDDADGTAADTGGSLINGEYGILAGPTYWDSELRLFHSLPDEFTSDVPPEAADSRRWQLCYKSSQTPTGVYEHFPYIEITAHTKPPASPPPFPPPSSTPLPASNRSNPLHSNPTTCPAAPLVDRPWVQ